MRKKCVGTVGVKQRVLFLIKNTVRKDRSNHVMANDWVSKKIRLQVWFLFRRVVGRGSQGEGKQAFIQK